ncbi:CoA transferase [Nitriliruptoraceae bacterium ZYF776]|nr:CoA transferase [Profundirhabdus halotolerans]
MSDRHPDDATRPPLDGVLVADLSRVLSGPLATQVLGDLGADVVKVEHPDGGDETRAWGPPWRRTDDGTRESTYHLAVNRNKRSVTLDLTEDHDLTLARRLCERADVVIENFRPGVAARLGLSYEELAATNPGVIYASISGFGTARQARALGGYDVLVQAVSGLMSVTGDEDGPPRKVGVAIVDVVAALYASNGILAALYERERSGRGQRLEVSLLGSALAALVNQTSATLNAGVVPGRLGNAHPSVAPYEVLATADAPLAVAIGSERLFGRLVDALGVPELADDPRFATNGDRVTNRPALVALLEERLATRGAAEWTEHLRGLGLPVGPVNDVEEAIAEAAALGLAPVVEVPRSDGETIATVRSPLALSRTPTRYRHAPPRLGEHDAEVRRWLATE